MENRFAPTGKKIAFKGFLLAPLRLAAHTICPRFQGFSAFNRRPTTDVASAR
jgi:hypothetical protein